MFVTLFPQIFSAITQPFPPSPTDFPPKFRNIWFLLTQTSRLRSEIIYWGKSLNLSRESKPNQSRSTQKENINVHLPKMKKKITRSINKQGLYKQKYQYITYFKPKTGLLQTNKLAFFSLKQINTLYTNARPFHKGRGEREGEGEVRDPFFIYSMP
jgi:hypothetical protein